MRIGQTGGKKKCATRFASEVWPRPGLAKPRSASIALEPPLQYFPSERNGKIPGNTVLIQGLCSACMLPILAKASYCLELFGCCRMVADSADIAGVLCVCAGSGSFLSRLSVALLSFVFNFCSPPL